MKKTIAAIIILLSAISSLKAEEEDIETRIKKKLFGGGMQVHFGYSNITTPYQKVNSLIFGIGGRAHFNVWDYFRIGIGGAATKTDYMPSFADETGMKSFVDMGYGGITLEFKFHYKRFLFSAGGLIGGGSYTSLILLSKSGSSYNTAYTEGAAFVGIPMITFELFITESLSATVMFDYFLGSKVVDGNQYGFRGHIGVIFYK